MRIKKLFKKVTTTRNISKKAPQTSPVERLKIEGQRIYCGKTCLWKVECRAKQRDEANGITKEGAIKKKQLPDPNKLKYNQKLVCQLVWWLYTLLEIAGVRSPRKAFKLTENFYTKRTVKKTIRIDDRNQRQQGPLNENKTNTLRTRTTVFVKATISPLIIRSKQLS